eukprot:SAG25_NODE_6805_length_528_cov_1.200466_1_plen_147_part_01
MQSCNSFLLRTYIPKKHYPSTLCSALLGAHLAIITKRGRKRWAVAFRTHLLEVVALLNVPCAPKLLRIGVVPHTHTEDRRARERSLKAAGQHARRRLTRLRQVNSKENPTPVRDHVPGRTIHAGVIYMDVPSREGYNFYAVVMIDEA